MSRVNRLTQVLKVLERDGSALPTAPRYQWRHGLCEGRYVLRVANDRASREKAYRLVYRLYLEKEYATPNASGMWLSIFDALPGAVTLVAERAADGGAVGAVTLLPDSPMGLPADALYGAELGELRASGRRPAEIVSLGVDGRDLESPRILMKLFNTAYLIARGVRGATDFVITVNPRHARFYERGLLFEEAGPERSYGKVGGAPAALLRLDFDLAERQVLLAQRGAQGARMLFRQARTAAQERDEIVALSRALRPMSAVELDYFLVEKTDLLARATPEERARLQDCCLAWEMPESLAAGLVQKREG